MKILVSAVQFRLVAPNSFRILSAIKRTLLEIKQKAYPVILARILARRKHCDLSLGGRYVSYETVG